MNVKKIIFQLLKIISRNLLRKNIEILLMSLIITIIVKPLC